MRHPKTPFPRAVLALLLLLGGGGALVAQPVAADARAPEPSRARATAFEQALAHLRGGRLSAAEAALGGTVASRPNSAAWHFQLASALVRAAFLLRQTGDAAMSTAVAVRALEQLGQAEAKLDGADAPTLAAPIKHMAGVVHERLAGTTESAKAFYRAAASLDPKSPAGAALGKLEEADRAAGEKQAAKPAPRR